MESTIERREQIAERLRFRRKDSLRTLANEFGVCRQTILRDIETLSKSYPISAVQGYGGGVFWTGKRPENVYTEREIEAIRNAIKNVNSDDAAVLEKLIAAHSVREPFDVEDIFKILATGITQTELAEMLGIGKSALSNYMAGRRVPNAEITKRIQKIKKEKGCT